MQTSSFEKFYELIDSSAVGRAVARRQDLIERTDPGRIYVENIRSFFNVPTGLARFFCELAVRERVFLKRIGYICPGDERIIRTFAAGEPVPDTLLCSVCEDEGRDEFEFAARVLETVPIYSLPGHT